MIRVLSSFVLILVITGASATQSLQQSYDHARQYIKKNPELGLLLGKEALKEAKAKESKYYELKSSFLIAWTYARMNQYDSAIVQYFETIKAGKDFEADSLQAIVLSCYKNLANIALDFDQLRLSEKLIEDALKISLSLGDRNQEIELRYNLISVLINSGRVEAAIDHSIQLNSELDIDHARKADTYERIGFAYQHLGDFKNAEEFYLKAKAVATEGSYHRIVNNMGNLYFENGIFDASVKHLEETRNIYLENEWWGELPLTCKALGQGYLELNDISNALLVWHEGIKHLDQNNISPNIYQIHRLVSDIYHGSGEYELADYHAEQYMLGLERYVANQDKADQVRQQLDYDLWNTQYASLSSVSVNEKRLSSLEIAYGIAALSLLTLFISAVVLYIQRARRNADLINALKEIEIDSEV